MQVFASLVTSLDMQYSVYFVGFLQTDLSVRII